MTLFLAFYIARILEPKMARDEKVMNFLLEKAVEIKKSTRVFYQKISFNFPNYTEITSINKKFNLKFQDFSSTINTFNIEDRQEILDQIKDNLKDLRQLSIEPSFYKYGSKSVKVVGYQDKEGVQILDDKIQYSDHRKDQIRIKIDELNNNFFNAAVGTD